MNEKIVLDATAGLRHMWFNKNNPYVVFLDRDDDARLYARYELYKRRRGMPGRSVRRSFKVPTTVGDYRHLPYPDGQFRVVVFDPPHRSDIGKNAIMLPQFGLLSPETWPADLRAAAKELWRVLAPYGVLIFKWSNGQIPYRDVLRLFPVKPFFGQVSAGASGKSGRKSSTSWFCFVKVPKEEKLFGMKVKIDPDEPNFRLEFDKTEQR